MRSPSSDVTLFVLRRAFLGVAALLVLSFGTYWFFARNFYGPAVVRGAEGNPLPIGPLWWRWLQGLFSGASYDFDVPGPEQPTLGPALAHTLVLLLVAFAAATVAALLLGVLAAVREGTILDASLQLTFYVAWSLPTFLIALIIQTAFTWLAGRGLNPLPLYGWAGYCPPETPTGFNNVACPAGSGVGYLLNVMKHVALPAAALATSFIGLHARYLRASLVVALQQPYVVTARAKGVPERRVVVRHALRNSLVAFTSVILLDFGALFGSALAVDWIFKIGGVGSLFLNLVAGPTLNPDALTSVLVITGVLVLTTSLLNDAVVPLLDPRARRR